jgi:hypothetical protein
MRFKSRLIRGTLIQRYKRFLADVRLENDQIVTAHCTNTGSMMGCKEPGSAVYISRSENLGRKLPYTWELIKADGGWVGINTMHPNKLVPEAVESGVIKELLGYTTIRREVKVSAHSRLDLCLEGSNGSCFSCDAVNPTVACRLAVLCRGTEQLREGHCALQARLGGHECAQACGGRDRQPQVIPNIRPRYAFRLVLVKARSPFARQIDLRGQRHTRRYQQNPTNYCSIHNSPPGTTTQLMTSHQSRECQPPFGSAHTATNYASLVYRRNPPLGG